MPSPLAHNAEFRAWCENLDRMAPQHHTINPIPASLEQPLSSGGGVPESGGTMRRAT